MEPQPLTAAERVARLIEKLGISSYQFGKETGLSHQTISNVLTGKNRPSLDTLEAIAARYPDTAVWLLTGTGETRTGIMPKAGESRPTAPAEPAADYTSGAGTIDATVNLLLKEQLKEARERATADRALIAWLQVELGKSPGSSDAAGSYAAFPPTPHVPVAGFQLSVQRRARGRAQMSR